MRNGVVGWSAYIGLRSLLNCTERGADKFARKEKQRPRKRRRL